MCLEIYLQQQRRFVNLQLKTYEFVTTRGDIIRLEHVGIVTLFLQNSLKFTFINITYAPESDFNFISLGKLRKTGILYHDHYENMILKQGGKTIGSVIRKQNLFVLDIQISGAILVKRKGILIYLVNKNSQIKLRHKELGYASYGRVVKASKLTNSIDITINEG